MANTPIKIPQGPTKFNELHDSLCNLNNRLVTETKKLNSALGAARGVNALPRAARKRWTMDSETFYTVIKTKFPLADATELSDIFESQKQKVATILTAIDATECNLDELVFDLYGLTDEERQTVRAKRHTRHGFDSLTTPIGPIPAFEAQSASRPVSPLIRRNPFF